jgi:dihydroorotate dehydrogenase (fumarate)
MLFGLSEVQRHDGCNRWLSKREYAARPKLPNRHHDPKGFAMIDLTTTYLGLNLKNPLVCSSSPMCANLENLELMQEQGAAAVVLHSLFEEQIELENADLNRFLDLGAESFAKANAYLPEMADYNLGIEGYLAHISECKAWLDIPVIASLNGKTPGGWVRHAREIQQAGADALELNIYFLPTDPARDAASIESEYIEVVRAVRAEVSIPLAVKLSPFFTAPAAFAARLVEAGASGLVLFNRFYQPDFDLERLEVVPSLHLSTPQELLLRLHWTAILYGNVNADIAVTGGVHSALDVLKVIMAGGRVAMTTSALLKFGIDHLKVMLQEITNWLADHDEYESIRQMQGSMSLKRVAHPDRFERANYLKVLRSYALRL